jgi:hypothetical protein
MTRSEAAAYLGLKSVEGIRHLQKSGKLKGKRDKNGHFDFSLEEIEPLRIERELEGLPRSPKEPESFWDRQWKEDAARSEKYYAEARAQEQARKDLREQQRRELQQFRASHLTDDEARVALGDMDRRQFDELVRQGLLHKVDPPHDPYRLNVTDVGSGPYFCRQEVLELLNALVAQSNLRAASSAETPKPHDFDPGVALVTLLLGALLGRASTALREPPNPPTKLDR